MYLATHKQTGYVLAVKKVKMNQTGNNVLTKEIEVLKKCKSPNILSYFGTCSLDNEVWVKFIKLSSFRKEISFKLTWEKSIYTI